MNAKLLVRGIRDPMLARELAAAGADWLALPVETELERAQLSDSGLIADLQETTDVVGDFGASSSVEEIDRVSLELDLDFACLYPGDREGDLAKLSIRWIADTPDRAQGSSAWARIVDCPADREVWPALAEAARAQRILVAVGEDEKDISAILEVVRPFGLVLGGCVTAEGFARVASKLGVA